MGLCRTSLIFYLREAQAAIPRGALQHPQPPNFAPYNNTFQIGNAFFGQSTVMMNQFLGYAGQSALYTLGSPRSCSRFLYPFLNVCVMGHPVSDASLFSALMQGNVFLYHSKWVIVNAT